MTEAVTLGILEIVTERGCSLFDTNSNQILTPVPIRSHVYPVRGFFVFETDSAKSQPCPGGFLEITESHVNKVACSTDDTSGNLAERNIRADCAPRTKSAKVLSGKLREVRVPSLFNGFLSPFLLPATLATVQGQLKKLFPIRKTRHNVHQNWYWIKDGTAPAPSRKSCIEDLGKLALQNACVWNTVFL